MEEADMKAGKWNNGLPTPFQILCNEGHYTSKPFWNLQWSERTLSASIVLPLNTM